MKLNFPISIFFALFFILSNSIFANSSESQTDVNSPSEITGLTYTLKGVDLFGGAVQFNFLYNNNQNLLTKSVPLPSFKAISAMEEDKKNLYTENRLSYISDLLHSSVYYFVLSDNEMSLAEIIDASLINNFNESVKISSDFSSDYSKLNNSLINTIKEAKKLTDDQLLSKINELNILILPSSPTNIKNDYLADFDIFSYSSDFLKNHFPAFKPSENTNDLYNTDGTVNLIDRVSNKDTENTKKESGNKTDEKETSPTFLFIISFFIVFLGFYIFFKKRKEV